MRKLSMIMLLVLVLVLAACGGAATPAANTGGDGDTAAEPPATEAPAEEPTEAPAEEPTEEPTEEAAEPTEEPTEEAAEEPTEEATEEAEEEPTEEAEEEGAGGEVGEMGSLTMDGDLAVLDAGSCDYGGKILSIAALDPATVEFTLCRPDPAFLAKIAFEPFGIQPSEHFEATGGAGELLESPIGTGPYMLEAWNRGDSVVYTRFDDYWGEPAIAETAVLRWATEPAARLLELQSGNVNVITSVGPGDIETVAGDPNLQLLEVANPNTLYIGMTNTFEPFNNVDVRRAIAMGIDRQRIVDNFFPEGSEVASHFTPCSIPNGCEGDEWYEFDAAAAQQALADAGYPDGFETNIYYRDVSRGYLPEPGLVAQDLQAQLAELGITAEIVVMESGEFIAESSAGNLDGFYLLGWGADYPHITNFLDYHFSEGNPQFGDTHPEIYEPLMEGSSIADLEEAAPIYEEANNAIRDLVPMIPVAHGATADAALASVDNMYTPPFGATHFSELDPGADTLVYMQNAEPISLFCADETDGETLRACTQVVEPLYRYATDSGDVIPALAEECVPDEELMVWTCALREGVTFHDGSEFDSNDVVMSWAVGLDAANPYHVGNTGVFEYYSYLWDGLMNAPVVEE
jgi:peptide/nickel transport system substrate-binding protein